VLFEGDGSLLMHIQEFEVIKRHGIKLLICVLNDGAYGAEIHQLRHDGIDDSGAIFGRTDLAAIAKGFGLRGTTVTDLRQLKPLFDAYQAQDTAEIWNIHVSDKVVNPSTQRGVRRGHGKM
jgi:acetolactate synthase-1/2/3 large subunit